MSIGPLTGTRVLDLTSYLAGPYGCTLLGDLGADIVKIESPEGDMMRHYPSTLPGESRAFIGANRNKRAMVLDLKKEGSLEVFDRLLAGADVLVHNFRPSVPERLGIGYERLRALNPRLVYCALTGYGDHGPMSGNAGFDQVLQSMTGIAKFQGADGPPQVVVGSIVDYYASSLVAYGVTAALLQRERGGKGQYLSVSLLRTAMAMQAGRFVWAGSEGKDVDRDLRPGRTAGIHPTKRGYLYISAHSTHFWNALCGFLGLDDLVDNPRYGDMRKRAEHADELLPRMHEALRARTAAEWEQLMKGTVACAEVRSIDEMFDHPQVQAENLVTTLEHATIGPYRTMTRAVHLSDTPGPATRPAPAYGQHTDELLSELGYETGAIERLKASGVAR